MRIFWRAATGGAGRTRADACAVEGPAERRFLQADAHCGLPRAAVRGGGRPGMKTDWDVVQFWCRYVRAWSFV